MCVSKNLTVNLSFVKVSHQKKKTPGMGLYIALTATRIIADIYSNKPANVEIEVVLVITKILGTKMEIH